MRNTQFVSYEFLDAAQRVVRERDVEGNVTAIVLKGTRLLGLESENDRVYLMPDPKLYEGVKINIDHPDYTKPVPSQRDKIGFVRPGTTKAVEKRGIFGDVVINPNHPLAESVAWDAENDPNNQGFSHVAITERSDLQEASDGRPVLSVVEVISVDLVGRPATTKGIFESKENETVDLTQALERIEALTQENAKLTTDLAVAAQNLQTEKDAHEATKLEHVAEARKAEREKLLEGIEGEIVPAFRNAVLNAESVEDAKALIESITKAQNKPKSEAQNEPASGKSAQTFEQADKAGMFDYKKGA